ncbi:MAG: ATP-binding cassette domain-containing protein [Acutalibacteraceae bacterium]|nr:ATP-binding cassette domain-containing protein [Acutalibacteraceae bacterium]
MVEVKNLVKRYGDKLAVDHVSFTVNEGEILGFLGPNGAGKSTTMNIITGYLSSTSGTVTIDGCEILDDPKGAKSKIGYLPEIPPLYQDMTVKRYLEFVYDLKKVTLPKKEHLEEVCKVTKITDVYNRIIKNLSKGYRQRVGLAQALIGNPPVIILDEPTVGLDPKQIIEMRNLIRGLGKKHTVILSSHVLSEIQAVCDRIVVINHGKLVADENTTDITTNLTGAKRIQLHIDGDERTVLPALRNIDGVSRVRKVMRTVDGFNEYIVESLPDNDTRKAIFKAMAKIDCPIVMMRNAEMSLEDAFLKITSGVNVDVKGGRK